MQTEDESFEQGLMASMGIAVETPVEVIEVVETPVEVIEVIEPEFTPAEVRAALDRLKDYDPSELTVALKDNRQYHSKIGILEQQIKQLLEEKPKAELSEEDFAELREEYPDLAERLIKGLSRITAERRVVEERTMPVDFTPLEQSMHNNLAKHQVEIERRFLRRAHKDFAEILQTPEWADWKAKQTEEFRANLEHSNDADFAIDALDLFKSQRQAVLDKNEQKQKRLAAAITPKPGAPAVNNKQLSDDEIFEQGMRQAANR